MARRMGQRKRRVELHAVDKPIRRPGMKDWIAVDLIVSGFLWFVRGVAWVVGAIIRAFV